MNQILIDPKNAPALTEREKVFVGMIEPLGWHFGGLTARGRGYRMNFHTGEAPLRAIHCSRHQLQHFVRWSLRNLQ
ncbi:MAG: hypothetical protein PHE83_09355 [Opitutaceae bacterium]|nr:hypothetical protein [Opitutaceae bacterium]